MTYRFVLREIFRGYNSFRSENSFENSYMLIFTDQKHGEQVGQGEYRLHSDFNLYECYLVATCGCPGRVTRSSLLANNKQITINHREKGAFAIIYFKSQGYADAYSALCKIVSVFRRQIRILRNTFAFIFARISCRVQNSYQ